MTAHLRFLGGRRIGGIIIAFTDSTRKDGYGNYWTRHTDFAFQRYNMRPLYYQHKGDMVEAAHIQASDLEVREEGVYMECEVFENEAGNAILDLIKHNRGFYSTGVMPGSWREASDGWIEFWPFVEVSVTDRPATRNGLTRASVVRSFLKIAGEGEEFLRRGPIMAENENGTGTPESVVAVENDGADVVTREEFDGLTQSVGAIADGVQQLLNHEPATRSLPPGGSLPGLLVPSAPVIEVAHQYDEMTLAGLSLWGNLRWQASIKSPGRFPFDGEKRTELIRALQGKIEKQQRIDNALTDEQLMLGHRRMIDYQMVDDWGKHIRADEVMKTDYADYGSGLIPTLLSSVLWYYFMLDAHVLNALPSFQMPSDTYQLPIITAGATIRAVPELADQANLGVHASVIPTSKITEDTITYTAGKIGALVMASRELFEDAAVSVAQMWSTQLIRDMASAIDWCLINGDETATTANISHLGTDPTSTAYDRVLEMDGLRHMAFGASQTTEQTAIDKNSNLVLREDMGTRGRFGARAKDLINIIDLAVNYDMLALEAIESVADVGAQNATLLTGMVGSLKGVPLVLSEELEGSNADGKIEDSHDTVLGSHLVVNKNLVWVGRRRAVEFELERVPGAEGYFVDTTARLDVQEIESGAVSYGFNVGGS